MANQCIVYINDNGQLTVVSPSPKYLQEHTMQELAQKDIPAGKNYKIIDNSMLPQDMTFRDAWTADASFFDNT